VKWISAIKNLQNRFLIPLKIGVIYSVVGAVYLLLSTILLRNLVSDPQFLVFLTILNGWLFVAVSAVLIYTLIFRNMTSIWQKEKQFSDLIDNSVVGISIYQDGQIIYQNHLQESYIGPLPRPTLIFNPELIYPDDRQKVKEYSDYITAPDFETGDLDFRFYPHDQSHEKINLKWAVCRAISIEYQDRRAVLFSIMDITKLKELERMAAVQDKMSSLGRVAAGVAHEIRNPLSGINIYLETLERIHNRDDSFEKMSQIITQLKSASRKIETVVRRVLDFANPGEPKFELIEINHPVGEAAELTSVTLRKSGIKLEIVLGDSLSLCRADSNQLEEVVVNLINNAAEAMRNMSGERRIKITTAAEGRNIVITVSDSGPGIPEDIRDKIFDPFYSSKDGNSGIGLSICRRIVNDHRGSIEIETSEWNGARFKIALPQVVEETVNA